MFDNACNVLSLAITQDFIELLTSFEPTDTSLNNNGVDLNENENTIYVKILQSFDMMEEAFRVTKNIGEKIEIGIKLKKIKECAVLCEQINESVYWKKIGDFAVAEGFFEMAENAYLKCDDLNSLLLIATSLADVELLQVIAQKAMDKRDYSIACSAYLNMANTEGCLRVLMESKRFGEALIFARYCAPSKVLEVNDKWMLDAVKNEDKKLIMMLESMRKEDIVDENEEVIEQLLKEKKIKISTEKLNTFNREYKKIDLPEFFSKKSIKEFNELLDELVLKAEREEEKCEE
jgi:tetratricopeptide (TPR) repeat protein